MPPPSARGGVKIKNSDRKALAAGRGARPMEFGRDVCPAASRAVEDIFLRHRPPFAPSRAGHPKSAAPCECKGSKRDAKNKRHPKRLHGSIFFELYEMNSNSDPSGSRK